ncbi:hypothetical protein TNIN_201371 [Trichonephila inaurata madagascariensis]|uniref:Uncharacterized protein n=1 Tax=Trichonephila inaurata madagascariensis TaxID=2747483 RepID=A0A8X6WQE7_9ARAC|nr:hypothetical protein TNIN_201371 [Trichonephila inaurata madagascariensis]
MSKQHFVYMLSWQESRHIIPQVEEPVMTAMLNICASDVFLVASSTSLAEVLCWKLTSSSYNDMKIKKKRLQRVRLRKKSED